MTTAEKRAFEEIIALIKRIKKEKHRGKVEFKWLMESFTGDKSDGIVKTLKSMWEKGILNVEENLKSGKTLYTINDSSLRENKH